MSKGLGHKGRWIMIAALACWGWAIQAAGTAPLVYTVDMRQRGDDLFKITLAVSDLTAENDIYQFASTAPGTYQTMNIGRFVRNFHAYDADGKELPVEHASLNQWRLGQPAAVRRISYTIAETWDTPVTEFPIYGMCSTSIEERYVMLMPHAVFGYPKGMQDRPMVMELLHPEGWKVGTALDRDSSGRYLADNYDHAVDSPILLGELTYASMDLHGALVEFYTYSKTNKFTSTDMLNETRDVLEAVGAFLRGFPVKRYTFLFQFDDQGEGAWEHSYSSNYAFAEGSFDFMRASLDGITAHEVFHIVTPLNIHSELIEEFNFVTPSPSQHLWLYEATTEWAAQAMLMRSGAITLDAYFEDLQRKMMFTNAMRKDLSLTEMARTSFTAEGAVQYPNIYMRGAITSTLLDIRLLELSGGKRGLRECMLELAKDYGKHKSFDEAGFFDEFAKRTYPEIRDFMARYIEGTEPLPVVEYFAKLGIDYRERTEAELRKPAIGVSLSRGSLKVLSANTLAKSDGLAEGDVLLSVHGQTVETEQDLGKVVSSLTIGEKVEVKVRRGEETTVLHLEVQERTLPKSFIFALREDASPEALALRAAWSRNL